MTTKLLFFALLISFPRIPVSAQDETDFLEWSATRKLTKDDFGIRTSKQESTTSFGQFSMSYQWNGLNVLNKNFNKRVHNYFIPSGSWLDTTTNLTAALTYQQTLFDLCEIYTRQFRKSLKENRKKLLGNLSTVDSLNNQYVGAFARRRLAYDRETAYGTIASKQEEWVKQIWNELEELAAFAYDR